jgi:hypothetical protein
LYQWQSGFLANNIEELIEQVQRAYKMFPPRLIDFAFLTLQCCGNDTLAIYGDSNYSIQHMGQGGYCFSTFLYILADGHGNVDEFNNKRTFRRPCSSRGQQNANDSDGLIMQFFATITFLTSMMHVILRHLTLLWCVKLKKVPKNS